MASQEYSHLLAAWIILSIGIAVPAFNHNNHVQMILALPFAAIILALAIGAKKGAAYLLDSDVEHELWKSSGFSFTPKPGYRKEHQAGVIIPLFISFLSIITKTTLQCFTLVTYETRARKARASKRFGPYSYQEMTDWHNALIGAAGNVTIIILATVAYFANNEFLARQASFYAFWNLLPISKLDGTQIFFGSKVLWTILATITLLFTLYAVS